MDEIIAGYRFESVKVAHGRRTILDVPVYHLNPGVHLLMGPNGSGKSTVLRMLAGARKPTWGCITFRCQPVKRRWFSPGHAAHCSADAAFYPTMTVAGALHLGLAMHGIRAASSVFDEDPFGLEQYADCRFQDLSLGWKKRLLIHMALASPAPVVLLDEPEAGLDEGALCVVGDWVERRTTGERMAVIVAHQHSWLKHVKHDVHALVPMQETLGPYALRRCNPDPPT